MSDVVGTARVVIVPDTTAFASQLSGQLAASTSAMTGAVTGLNAGLTTAATQLKTFGTAATAAGARLTKALTLPIVGVGAVALKAGADFETAMLQVQAVSGATGDEFVALEDLAKELGRTTQFSASQAADAMGFLAMAGFEANEILGALPGTLNLAAAGNLELAQSADIVTNVLTGYGKEVQELGAANDSLVNTFTSANTSLAQLGEAFKFVAPVANTAGLDFNEVTAALGLLGNAGIQASMAGTTLRGAVAKLSKPTAEAQEALDRLGITVTNTATGDMLPLVDIIRQFEAAGLSTADAMTIFGLRAGPGFAALVDQGADALDELTTSNALAGQEAEIAAEALGFEEAAAQGLTDAFLASLPVIQQYNENTDETTAILGALAASGQDATESAESLQGIVAAFSTDTQTFADALGGAVDGVGFMVDETGNLIEVFQDGTSETVTLLDAVTRLEGAGLSTEQLMAQFGDTVGTDLADALSVGSDEMIKIFEATTEAGRAAEIADIQMSGVRGAMLRLKSAAEGVAIAFSEAGVLDALANAAEFLATLLQRVAELNPEFFKWIAIIGGVLAAIGPLLFIVGKLATGLGGLAAILSGTSPLLASAGALFGNLTGVITALGRALLGLALNPVVLGIGLVVGAFVLMLQNSEELREALGRLAELITGALGAAFGLIGDAIASLASGLGDSLAPLAKTAGDALAGVINTVTDFFGALSSGEPVVDAFVTAFEAIFGTGEEASETLDGLIPIVSDLADFFSNLWEQLGNLVDVFREGDDVAQGFAEVMDNIFGNTGDLIPVFQRLGQAIEQVIDLFSLGFEVISSLASGALGDLTDALGDVLDAFQALISGDFDGFVEAISSAGENAIDAVRAFALDIPTVFFQTLANAFQVGLAQLSDLPIIGPLADSLSDGLFTIQQAVGNLSAAIGAALEGNFDFALEFIGRFVQNVVTLITVDLPNALGDLSDILGGPVRDAVTAAFEAVLSAVGDIPLVGPIVEALQTAFTAAIDVVAAQLDFFGALFSGDIGGAASALAEQLQLVFDAAIDILFTTIPDALSDLGEVLAGPITDGLSTALDQAAAGLDDTALGGVADFLAESIPNATEGAGEGLQSLAETVRDLPDLFSRIVDTLGDFIPVEDLIANLRTVFEGFLPILQALGEVLVDDIIPAITEDFLPILQNLGEVVGKVVGAAFVVAVGIIERLSDILAGLVDAGLLDAVADAVRFLGDAFSGAVDAVRGLTDILAGIFSADLDQVREGIVTLAQGILDTFTAVLADLPTAAVDAIQAVSDAIFGGLADIPVLGELFESLQQIIAEVGDALRGVFDILGGIFSLDGERILEGLSTIGESLLGLLREAFTAIPEILGDIISDGLPAIFGAFTGIGDFLEGLFDDVPIVGEIFDQIGSIISGVGEQLQAIFDVLAGIFTLDPGRILDGLTDLGASIAGLLGDLLANAGQLLADLAVLLFESFKAAFPAIGDFLSDTVLPAIGDFFSELPGRIIGFLGDAAAIAANIAEWFLGVIVDFGSWIFSDGIPAIIDFLVGIPGAIFDFFSGGGADEEAGGEGGGLIEWATNAFAALGEWLVTTGIPMLVDFVAAIPGKLIEALGALGELLVDAFTGAWDFVVENGPIILANLILWLDGLIDSILEWIGDLPGALVDFVTSAWDFVVENGPTILANIATWFGEMIGNILEWIGDLAGAFVEFLTGAFQFIIDNGPTILANIAMWFGEMIGNILGWIGDLAGAFFDLVIGAFQFIVDNGPTILANVLQWFTELPGKILEAVGDLGETLRGWVEGAFNFLVQKLPELVTTVIDWFKGLIGDILQAILDGATDLGGEIANFAAGVWNSIAGFLNEKLIDPIREVSVPVVGKVFDFLPRLPDNVTELAEGGIVTSATPAIIGEAGPEVVIPLTDTDRAIDLAQASGLFGLLAANALDLFTTANTTTAAAGAGPAFAAVGTGFSAGAGGGTFSSSLALGSGDAISALAGVAGDAGDMTATSFTEAIAEALMQGGQQNLNPAAKSAGEDAGMTFDLGLAAGMEGGIGEVEAASAAVIAAAEAVLQSGAEAIISEFTASLESAGATGGGAGAPGLGGPSTTGGGSPGGDGGLAGLISQTLADQGILSGDGIGFGDFTHTQGAAISAPIVPLSLQQAREMGFAVFRSGSVGSTEAFAHVIQGSRAHAMLTTYGSASAAQDATGDFWGPGGTDRLFGEGGIVTQATRAIIGEAGPEVVLPLSDPQRVLELATASGLFGILASALRANAPGSASAAALAPTAAAPAAPPATAPRPRPQEEAVVGSSGNTYNIFGVSADDVVAKITAREQASMRRIRR